MQEPWLSEPFTLIHVSDLHFHALPRWPGHWLTKRGVGALNLLLRRRWQFPPERARRLVRQIEALPWDHLVVSGDLTQLGLRREFQLARQAMAPWLVRGPEQVTIIPGNHDRYTARDVAPGPFDEHFGRFAPQGRDRFSAKRLNDRWWLAAWDSAVPRPVFEAGGRVAEETLRATERWLASLPSGARVVLTNHYPLHFPDYHHPHAFHELENLAEVRAWIARQPIEVYLHGHVHHNWVIPQPGAGLIQQFVNSAASSQIPSHRDHSSFHRIRLNPAFANLLYYRRNGVRDNWAVDLFAPAPKSRRITDYQASIHATWTPDGRILAGSMKGPWMEWTVADSDGRLLSQIASRGMGSFGRNGRPGIFYGCYSNDGQRLAVATRYDQEPGGSLWLMNRETGKAAYLCKTRYFGPVVAGQPRLGFIDHDRAIVFSSDNSVGRSASQPPQIFLVRPLPQV